MAQRKKKSTREKQTLILWALLVQDNAAAFQNELKPEPDRADRDALEAAGLIKSGKIGQRIRIEVTPRGWEWAGKNLGANLPTNSSAGSQILQAWLARLQAFMDARNVALVDILAPQGAPQEQRSSPETITPSAPVDHAAMRKRIRTAYLDLTGGRLNTRALLRELREKLKDIERTTLDQALKRMQSEEEASLYQLDNRIEITDADRAAAIHFGGEPRHILWIER